MILFFRKKRIQHKQLKVHKKKKNPKPIFKVEKY